MQGSEPTTGNMRIPRTKSLHFKYCVSNKARQRVVCEAMNNYNNENYYPPEEVSDLRHHGDFEIDANVLRPDTIKATGLNTREFTICFNQRTRSTQPVPVFPSGISAFERLFQSSRILSAQITPR